MAEEKKYTPLLPFDITYGEQFALYDSMTYICDNDICNAAMIKMESGNVCKYYRCKSVEPVKIGGDIFDTQATEIEEETEALTEEYETLEESVE